MANFGQLILTNLGMQEQYNAQSGNPLKFKRIGLGSGRYTGNITALTKLVTENVSVNITDGYIHNEAYIVEGFFSNEGLQTGFQWREIGLFVEGKNGEEVLYCYANAGESYDYIPATEDERYSKYIRIATAIGNATDVSIVENEDFIYVDAASFKKYKDSIETLFFKGYIEEDGDSYSGISSDCGIAIGHIKGNSVQDGTPTPDLPIEIEDFNASKFISHSRNLFDASKLKTISNAGATVTNNGDGSFTVSGSGTLTSNVSEYYYYTHEKTIRMFKAGKLYFSDISNTTPKIFVHPQRDNKNLATLSINSNTFEITQEMLDDDTFRIVIGIYGNADDSIVNGIIKPMLYQDGDKTWESYKYDETPFNIVLRSLPNGVHDTYENGVITRRVGVVTLDGTETWYSAGTQLENTFTAYVGMNDMKKVASDFIFLCDKFIGEKGSVSYKTNDSEFVCSSIIEDNSDMIILRISKNRASDIDTLKAWLASNPVTVYYELATPTKEKVNIPLLPSYCPWTEVFHDSDLESGGIVWNVNTSGNNDNINDIINKFTTEKLLGIIGFNDESKTFDMSNIEDGIYIIYAFVESYSVESNSVIISKRTVNDSSKLYILKNSNKNDSDTTKFASISNDDMTLTLKRMYTYNYICYIKRI